MKLLMRSVLAAVLASSSFALAQDLAAAPAKAPVKVPAADAVRDTWNYVKDGKGQGPVLVEAKLCTEIGKDGPNKFECTVEVGAEVKANTTVMLWQAYLVPQGDSYEDLMVQVKQGNTVRETKDVKVKGEGWRTRNWTGVRLNKAGDWTVSVVRGDQVLKEVKIKVTP